eukprot:CAMPEP_0197519902 /NCGR_PEP_ID=MMETSP1318-20131121/5185_1 /TAXON_ID=552666 /ORGANISM="Partenskyella glossopodia, Strain RCC365" /LENGTH=215 /DNA_ID=CAMNT_0043071151 /DNA_START=204 /DNA_END=851 /DNA_ORIENTATION=+
MMLVYGHHIKPDRGLSLDSNNTVKNPDAQVAMDAKSLSISVGTGTETGNINQTHAKNIAATSRYGPGPHIGRNSGSPVTSSAGIKRSFTPPVVPEHGSHTHGSALRRVRSEFLAGSKTAKRRATAGATGSPSPLPLPANSMLPSLDPQTADDSLAALVRGLTPGGPGINPMQSRSHSESSSISIPRGVVGTSDNNNDSNNQDREDYLSSVALWWN